MRRHLLVHLILIFAVTVALFFAARVYNNRGFANRQQGNLDQAIADYDMAIRLNPNYAALSEKTAVGRFGFRN